MVNDAQKTRREYIIRYRKELEEALTWGDKEQICLCQANLGFVLFQTNKFKEGVKYFNQAHQLAEDIGDYKLQAQCLGINSLAFQNIERHTDAYKVSEKILELAQEHDDPGMECDALASQGQILLDSGEQVISFEKFNQSLEIANRQDDRRRMMNVQGALGNYYLAVASVDQAEAYFRKARGLAVDLNERQAEYGFLGNIGTIYEWKRDYVSAAQIFSEVLSYLQEAGDQIAQIQALRHLMQVHEKLHDDEKVREYAEQGIKLCEQLRDDTIFVFYEALIQVYYRKELLDEAHLANVQAIKQARSMNDRTQEVNFRLSLGESYMSAGEFEKALEQYRRARDGAHKLDRHGDEAYLVGRIGVVHAEMGQMDEAITCHEESLQIAREMSLTDLVGEQLTMLSMAYLDKNELEAARTYCLDAIDVYKRAELTSEAANARRLLDQIDTNDHRQLV